MNNSNNDNTALVTTTATEVHDAVVLNQKSDILATKRTDLKLVDPRNCIVEEDFNVRIDYGDIKGLARSVVALGVLDPIIGFKVPNEDKFIMTEGHRRLAAVMLAIQLHNAGEKGFEDISKILYIPMRMGSSNKKDRLYTMAVTGEKKKALTDYEKVKMYARLIEIGKEEGKKKSEVINEIKDRLGLSHATVYNTLKINELPEQIQQSIAKNKITMGTVNMIVREIKDPTEQIEAVNQAIADAEEAALKGGKSKATAKHVKNLTGKSPMSRLKEVSETLKENGIDNKRSQFLIELLDALENKKSVNKILEMFVE